MTRLTQGTHAEEIRMRPCPTWNPRQALKKLGGDANLLRELVQLFLDGAPVELVRLQKASVTNDGAMIEATAHKFRGELAFLGLSELSAKAREIEEMARTANIEHSSSLIRSFITEVCDNLDVMRDSLSSFNTTLRGEYGNRY